MTETDGVTIDGVPRMRPAVRSARALSWRAASAVSLAALLAAPAEASGQARYSGPAVVPPSSAYVGDPDSPGGGNLLRWRPGPRGARTLRVHFEEPPEKRPYFWRSVQHALDTWNEVGGLPVSLRVTAVRGSADIVFRWTRHFDESHAGITNWTTDAEGWLRSVTVTLAERHVDGTPMSDEFLLFVALHELGHALGLPHSDDPSDVMHPGNRNRRLSARDVRSVLHLYGVATIPEGVP